MELDFLVHMRVVLECIVHTWIIFSCTGVVESFNVSLSMNVKWSQCPLLVIYVIARFLSVLLTVRSNECINCKLVFQASLVTSRFILRWLVLLSALIPDNNRQEFNRPVIWIFHNQA